MNLRTSEALINVAIEYGTICIVTIAAFNLAGFFRQNYCMLVIMLTRYYGNATDPRNPAAAPLERVSIGELVKRFGAINAVKKGCSSGVQTTSISVSSL